jgi:hypothetical protein
LGLLVLDLKTDDEPVIALAEPVLCHSVLMNGRHSVSESDLKVTELRTLKPPRLLLKLLTIENCLL